MPIYAYKCDTCGFAKDVLRKISDAPLTECPSCGAATFSKQVTAAGFQLKGSGWYVTDFRSNNAAKPAAESASSDAPVAGGENAAAAGKGDAGAPASAPGVDVASTAPAAKKEAPAAVKSPAVAPKSPEK